MNLKKLRKDRVDLHAKYELAVAEFSALSPDVTPTVRAAAKSKADGIKAEFDTIGQQIDLAEKADAMRMREYADSPDDASQAATQAALARAGFIEAGGIADVVAPAAGIASLAKFRAALRQHARDMGGFTRACEDLTAIARGQYDGRLQAAGQMGEEPSAGGFALSPATQVAINEAAIATEVILPRARIVLMSSREASAAVWDDADLSADSMAGLTMGVTGEGVTTDPQTARLRAIRLKPRKFVTVLNAANELLADAPTFEGDLTGLLGARLARTRDKEFSLGTGIGAAGMLTSNACVTVARETAGSITYGDVTAMLSRLRPASLASAIWVGNASVIPSLMQLSFAAGTGGVAAPVLQRVGAGWKLLGFDAFFLDFLPALGSARDLNLVDPAAYVVGVRLAATLERSAHLGFLSDSTYFRFSARFDGSPILDKPITGESGPTTSPFVSLS